MAARSTILLSLMVVLGSCHVDRRGGGETGGTDVPDAAYSDSGAEDGSWTDTGLDPGPDRDAVPDAGLGRCPAEAPISQTCADEGLRCEYGTECCCGQCYPSLVCECQGGHFGCYYTDACLIPGCPDAMDAGDPGGLDAATSEDAGTGQDAGLAIQCGSFPPVFPVFDESCHHDEDCVVVFHQRDCCGTQVAWGIAASAKPAFDQAEEECRAQYPACGCPAAPTEAEDGNIHWDPEKFAVRCKSGACFSYVEGSIPHCHDANDCDPGQICLAPGEQPPCGICRQPGPVCVNDADCGLGQVCEWVAGPCVCEPALQCVVRCDLPTGSLLPPCKPGEACVDGHCVAQTCQSDADCLPYFLCDPSQGTCARLPCQSDGDCKGGRCVKGACYDALGTCSYLPP